MINVVDKITWYLGGLGSYTPSKIQISEAPFQLGVSRTSSSSSTSTPTTNSSSNYPASVQSSKAPSSTQETILLPADDGVSWGSAASSDMLFWFCIVVTIPVPMILLVNQQ